jgi:hypothetical protein
VKTARNAALFILLIALTLVEFCFCTAFLPAQWQHVLDERMRSLLPKSHDWTATTHPLLSREIEQLLGEHIGLRIALYVVTLALLIGNGLLIAGSGFCYAAREIYLKRDDQEFLSDWVPVRTCPVSSIKDAVKRKHNCVGWNFSWFAARG